MKRSLTPPPVPPPLLFQTVSPERTPPLAFQAVPPQPTTHGLDAGKSTWGLPSVWPSVARPSPEAAKTETPACAASWNADVMAVIACCVQPLSGEPQLIDMTLGLFVASCTAWVMASTKPWSVFGAK